MTQHLKLWVHRTTKGLMSAICLLLMPLCLHVRRREGASPARRAARARLSEFPLHEARVLFSPSATSGDEEDQPQPQGNDAPAAGDAGDAQDLPQVGHVEVTLPRICTVSAMTMAAE